MVEFKIVKNWWGNTPTNPLIFSEKELSTDHIIYGGDSFTWGEGLELYIDNPFWQNERHNQNLWMELVNKQTKETRDFRRKNRFAGIIESKTGYKQIVDPRNGGNWETGCKLITYNLRKNTKAIVYQFTQINRNFLHSNTNCICGFCGETKPQPFNVYMEYLELILNNKNIPLEMESLIDYLEKYENIPKLSIDKINEYSVNRSFDVFIDSLFYNIQKRNVEYFVSHFLVPWTMHCPVYLIDSWDGYTSDTHLTTHPLIKKHLINLKGLVKLE